VSKELAFEKILRQRRTGDVHEGPGGAIARVVDDFRDEVFPCAAFAREQHRRGGAGGDFGDQMPQRRHRFRRTNDAMQVVRPGRVGSILTDLAAKARRFERPLDGRHHLVEVERLVGKVVRPKLHRLDRRFDARIGGEENDERVLVELLDFAQHRNTVGVRQFVIEQDEVNTFSKLLERRGPGCGLEDPVALALQPLGQRPPDEFFVVDN
jgi:hypothetical protein